MNKKQIHKQQIHIQYIHNLQIYKLHIQNKLPANFQNEFINTEFIQQQIH